MSKFGIPAAVIAFLFAIHATARTRQDEPPVKQAVLRARQITVTSGGPSVFLRGAEHAAVIQLRNAKGKRRISFQQGEQISLGVVDAKGLGAAVLHMEDNGTFLQPSFVLLKEPKKIRAALTVDDKDLPGFFLSDPQSNRRIGLAWGATSEPLVMIWDEEFRPRIAAHQDGGNGGKLRLIGKDKQLKWEAR